MEIGRKLNGNRKDAGGRRTGKREKGWVRERWREIMKKEKRDDGIEKERERERERELQDQGGGGIGKLLLQGPPGR